MALEKVKDELGYCFREPNCYMHGPHNPFAEDVISAPYRKCPSYEYFHFRSHTLTGRMDLAERIYYHNFPATQEMVKPAWTCLGDGTCAEMCRLGKGTWSNILRALREELVEKGFGPPEANKRADENIKKVHNVIGGKDEKKVKWAEGLGLPKTGSDVFFSGCSASFLRPEIAKAEIKVLRAAGLDIAYLGEQEWCCGLPAGWDGQMAIEETMAQHNVEALKAAGAKRVIFDCPGCFRTFQLDYPKIVGKLPFELVHTSQLLAESMDKLRFKKYKEKLTYHDPCHLGRHMKVYEEPRKVITSIPGVELVEMPRNRRWAWCCGSGRGVTLRAEPEYSLAVAKERLEEAKATANTLVTACPLCVDNLSRAANKLKIDINIISLPELVAAALKIR
jgi:heterodisulfide reductase subunit D